eukprot:2869705-Prymnesium_polylepis.1
MINAVLSRASTRLTSRARTPNARPSPFVCVPSYAGGRSCGAPPIRAPPESARLAAIAAASSASSVPAPPAPPPA